MGLGTLFRIILPVAVEQDVRNEYVSIERAKVDYGVVIDPETLKFDPAKTQKLREQRKQKK